MTRKPKVPNCSWLEGHWEQAQEEISTFAHDTTMCSSKCTEVQG